MDALGLHGGWRFIDLWFEGTKLEICISGSISGGGLFIVSSGLGNGDMGPYGTKLACWVWVLGQGGGVLWVRVAPNALHISGSGEG